MPRRIGDSIRLDLPDRVRRIAAFPISLNRVVWRRDFVLPRMQARFLQRAIGPLFGAIFFFSMFDARLLNPTYVDWLFPNQDSRMQFIGWQFFRLEPWHVPPGAATNYGMEIGSSIVFTDAVPLFAFIFKMLRAVLPDKFQYMGFWILACYIAQGAMAWLLSGAITERLHQRCVIVAFFVASPILVSRGIAHHALMGHWLLLAALYMYVRSPAEYSSGTWCLLLSVAALVNAYLLYMALAIWLADLARRVWLDRVLTYKHAARSIATAFVTLSCTMWIAGYFTIPVGDFSGGAEHYGKFAANLNSLWNPLWIPSLFLSPRPLLPGSEIEGSSYLGVGVMAMVPIAAFALLRSRLDKPLLIRYIPLAVVSLVLWALALSHQLMWGDKILLIIPLPSRVLDVLASVRGSGRLLWVAYYGLILGVLAVVTTRLRPAVATWILVAGLAVQAVDLFPQYFNLRQSFHQAFTETPEGMKPLQSPFWQIVAKHYRRILFVPVTNKPPDYDVFAFFAEDHGMAINVGYFARVSNARIDAANAILNRELTVGPLRQDSLYVFWNGEPMEDSLRVQDGVGVVDGYAVVAPGWFEFDDCCGQANGALHRPGAAAARAVPARSGPRLAAEPNPVPAGPAGGITTITWTTGDESVAEVYVSINGQREILFSGASSRGSQDANWIGADDRCEFRLYDGTDHTTLLAVVTVTGRPVHATESPKSSSTKAGLAQPSSPVANLVCSGLKERDYAYP